MSVVDLLVQVLNLTSLRVPLNIVTELQIETEQEKVELEWSDYAHTHPQHVLLGLGVSEIPEPN